jgi:hypothetical protein
VKLGPLLLAFASALGACRAAPPDRVVALEDADVESLDPHASGGRYASQNVLENTYEGLVGRDAELRLRWERVPRLQQVMRRVTTEHLVVPLFAEMEPRPD